MSEGRPTVIVIEDEPELRPLLAITLAKFEVLIAEDGAKGLELARTRAPDAIVTDVLMPKLSGEELLAALKGDPETREIPILILTAKADVAFRARMLASGAEDFVPKPFSPVELVARVSNAVSRKRTRDVLRAALENKDADVERLARDLAERRRDLETALSQMEFARDQALRASELKGNFLNMVSHELRTPLTSIRLLVDRLARIAGSLPPKTADLIARLDTATQRMLRLVDSLLEYARVERDRLTLEIVPFSPVALLKDLVLDFRTAAEEKSLSITLDFEGVVDASFHAVGDPKLVRIVLSNLLLNAIRFTESGGITVACFASSESYGFRVKDTGPGIPPGDHAMIFEPFKQREPIRHKHTPGFGLGLALVKDIVRSLGGEIELVSDVGAGSTFTTSFPRDLRT